MIKVDATGQTCPMPVIMTKNALKEISEGTIEVTIDNKISKENIEKFAKEMGFSYITEEDNGTFFIQITKQSDIKPKEVLSQENIVISIGSDKMGEGDPALGETLMKGFLYTLTEMETLPNTILLYNRGVYLSSLIESAVKDLKDLENRGVEILSCGACANFYHLEDKIAVGCITNMYNIIDKQLKATKVIKP